MPVRSSVMEPEPSSVRVTPSEVAAPRREAVAPSWDLLLDARLLSALALLVVARLSGNLLAALGVGALVLLLA